MLITKAGQTPYELSEEFIKGMKEATSGSKDMDTLFDAYVSMENDKVPPEAIIEQIQHVCHTDMDASGVEFIKNTKPNISPVLLAWIAMQSSAIPDTINTLLGLYCTYFYKTHDLNEQITLKWVGETVGKGKLVDFRSIWPWFSASRCEDNKSCFLKMTREDFKN